MAVCQRCLALISFPYRWSAVCIEHCGSCKAKLLVDERRRPLQQNYSDRRFGTCSAALPSCRSPRAQVRSTAFSTRSPVFRRSAAINVGKRSARHAPLFSSYGDRLLRPPMRDITAAAECGYKAVRSALLESNRGIWRAFIAATFSSERCSEGLAAQKQPVKTTICQLMSSRTLTVPKASSR